jgi:hypothetical protein
MRALKPLAASSLALAAAAAPFARGAAPPSAGDAGAPPARVVRSPLNPYVDAGAGPKLQLDPNLVSKVPPDPPAMRERSQLIFDFKWDKGDLYLLGVHRIDLPAAQETPRAMGRFALELFEGPTLIERVRFDFPMLGAGEPLDAGGIGAPARFEPKLVTRIGVMFPAPNRGTRLELFDRATQRRYPLPWPPPAHAPDAG